MSIVGPVQTGCCSAGGRLELSSEALWVFSFLYTVFYCEYVQISGKMRPRFSCMRAVEYPYMQTSVFAQLQNVHKWNSNSLRLPRLVCNGWQSSLVALSLGRLRQGRDEGTRFIPSAQFRFCAAGRILAGTFPGDVYNPRQRFAGSESVLLSRLTAECFCLWISCNKGDGLGKIML